MISETKDMNFEGKTVERIEDNILRIKYNHLYKMKIKCNLLSVDNKLFCFMFN